MTDLPPLLRDQRKVDADHLKMLAIFHFVGVGLALLGIGFLFLHYTVMHMVMSNAKVWEGQKNALPPQEFFAIFKWFYLVLGVFLVASGIGNLLSGLWILARKNRMFSLVVAGLNCLHVPLGTVLGVFTMIVLLRDSVRELYED